MILGEIATELLQSRDDIVFGYARHDVAVAGDSRGKEGTRARRRHGRRPGPGATPGGPQHSCRRL